MTRFRPVFCLWLAVALGLGATPAHGEPVAVYGLELEVDQERERLLIFSGAPIEPRLIPVDDRTVMVALPGTFLDPSAPTRIVPGKQGTVRRVTAFDRSEPGSDPEVRVVVQRRPGTAPNLERRASIIALDFPPMPRLQATRQAGERVSVDFDRTPMRRVVSELATATGETLIFDDRVSGVLTVEGPEEVSRGEALALLDSALLLRGFVAVPAPGGGRKIVQILGAQGPLVDPDEVPDSDAPITTLVRLKTMNAEDLAPVFTFFLPNPGDVRHFEPTNSLILSGAATRVRALQNALSELDDVDLGRWVIWKTQFADAESLAEQIQEVIGERDVPNADFDARTNSVILRVSSDSIERARELARRLDRPARGAGEFQVVPVQHADPERLVEILQALRDDSQPTSGELLARSLGVPRAQGLQGRDFSVTADAATHSLVVRAMPRDLGAVLDVVRQLDLEPRVVRLSLDISRIDVDDDFEFGPEFVIPSVIEPDSARDLIAQIQRVDAGGILDPGAGGDLPALVANYTRAPLNIPIVDAAGQVFILPIPRESVSYTLNGRTVNAESVVRPRILVTSGEEHELFAGDNIPVPVASGNENNIVGQVQQNIERYDVGTRVRVTPTLGEQGTIQLDLGIEVTSLAASVAGDVEEVGPTISELSVESVIRLRNGEAAIIATQSDEFLARTETGVPWLSDIPFLKWAYTSVAESVRKRYLLIHVQAEVIQPEAVAWARELERKLSKGATPEIAAPLR